MKLSLQISKLEYWVYGLSLALCFLLFKQSDLTHTNSASFAYLYGHFWDFYDYNSTRMGDNNYLPIFYWFFAIWNIPLKLLDLIPEVTSETWMQTTVIQTIWSKLLLVIFFFAAVNLVGKIAKQVCATISNNRDIQNESLPKLLFATSPIAIFAVFIFGGYDIFALFFMLLGLRAYFAKDFKWFVVWFSIAISFKYFAAFVYLPLVLMIEKRFIYLLIYGLLGLAVTAMQFVLYWHSDIFLGEIFGLVGAKATGNAVSMRFVIANTVYGVMCLYLYFSKLDSTTDPQGWFRRTIFACILSYAVFFSWVLWHPQWVILITPFFCLSFLFIRSQKLFRLLLVIEILGYLGFAVYTMNNWVGNVDNTMIYGGVFGGLLPQTSVLASDIIGRSWMATARVLLYFFLYAPCIFLAFQYFANKNLLQNHIQNKMTAQPSLVSVDKFLLGVRFLSACYLYVAVTALCFW